MPRSSKLTKFENSRKERMVMILRSALDLSKSIDDYRLDMYELAKNKGLSDPDVIKKSAIN
ncbi:hypothetical protein GCM10020331_009640 [Ectobacillus funiculus]